jgi:hypothetical protein
MSEIESGRLKHAEKSFSTATRFIANHDFGMNGHRRRTKASRSGRKNSQEHTNQSAKANGNIPLQEFFNANQWRSFTPIGPLPYGEADFQANGTLDGPDANDND